MFFSYCSTFASPYLYFCSRQLTSIIFRYTLPIRNTYDYDYHPVFSVQYRFIIHNIPFFTLKSSSDLDGKLFDYCLMIYMFTVIVKSLFFLCLVSSPFHPAPQNPLPYGSCQSVFCMYKTRQKFFQALSHDWSAAYVWMWQGNCSLLLL